MSTPYARYEIVMKTSSGYITRHSWAPLMGQALNIIRFEFAYEAVDEEDVKWCPDEAHIHDARTGYDWHMTKDTTPRKIGA